MKAPTITVLPEEITDLVHREAIGPFLAQATANLATRPFMRCVCVEPWCLRGQVELEAWHLYWAQTDNRGHDPGDEDDRDRKAHTYRWSMRFL